MSTPSLRASRTIPTSDEVGVIVLGASVDGTDVHVHATFDTGDLEKELRDVGFTGKRDEVVRLPGADVPLAVVGLAHPRSAESLRYAAGTAVRQLASVPDIGIALPANDGAELTALVEGAALGAYEFDAYKTGPAASRAPRTVIVHTAAASAEADIRRALAAADAVRLVKDLVNTPALDLYPETLVDATREAVGSLPVQLRVWDEVALAEEGYGGILGVGQGSTRPPRLVKLSYAPEGASTHLALVGKGITFDSGGLSLKPAIGMIGMKYDMTGAATVLAVVRAAAELELPVAVTAWMCLAENMPSGSAIRPGDVLRIHGGRTVEVLNTDAEGRLVLADGLVAASAEQPDAIVDVATLTGAAMVALGTRYTPVMGQGNVVQQVLDAAAETDELLWPMPLPEEIRATINSDVADIANANPGVTAGGMLLAALFLKEFVGEREDGTGIPWAHLDIAGPAKGPASPYGFTGKGPTGVTVRALLRLAEKMAER